jgi:ribosomal protein S18 acetylase RimI-like enzyme
LSKSKDRSDIQVRKATPDDAESIARWQLAMALETENFKLDPKTVLAGVRHVFAEKNIGEYLIGMREGVPVACMLLLREWSDWRCGTLLWIHSLYVEPVARRSGIFRLMYDFVKNSVEADSKLRGIRLYVDKTNHAAIATYTNIGMDGSHYQTFEWMKS